MLFYLSPLYCAPFIQFAVLDSTVVDNNRCIAQLDRLYSHLLTSQLCVYSHLLKFDIPDGDTGLIVFFFKQKSALLIAPVSQTKPLLNYKILSKYFKDKDWAFAVEH